VVSLCDALVTDFDDQNVTINLRRTDSEVGDNKIIIIMIIIAFFILQFLLKYKKCITNIIACQVFGTAFNICIEHMLFSVVLLSILGVYVLPSGNRGWEPEWTQINNEY